MNDELLLEVRDTALRAVDESAAHLAGFIRVAVDAEDEYYRNKRRIRVDGRPWVRDHLRTVMHRLQAAQEPRS